MAKREHLLCVTLTALRAIAGKVVASTVVAACLGAILALALVASLSVFAFGTIQAALFLVFGYTTVKGKWAQVEGVKATAEGYIVPAILLVFHLYIMFTMGDIIYA